MQYISSWINVKIRIIKLLEGVREKHGIGVPLFVRDDGGKTLDINEAFAWIGQPPVEEDEIVEHA